MFPLQRPLDAIQPLSVRAHLNIIHALFCSVKIRFYSVTEDVKEADQAVMNHKERRSEAVDDAVLRVFYTKLVKWCVVDQIGPVYWLSLDFPTSQRFM